MKKILVIGCPGAGKSRYAKKLAEKLNIPLYHIDNLFWNSDKTHCSQEELEAKFKEIFKSDSYILDGNYISSLKMRFEDCDTVFFLDYELGVCLEGIKGRTGTEHDDLPWMEDKLSGDFFRYVMEFPMDQKPYIKELKALYPEKVVRFKTREESYDFLDNLK